MNGQSSSDGHSAATEPFPDLNCTESLIRQLLDLGCAHDDFRPATHSARLPRFGEASKNSLGNALALLPSDAAGDGNYRVPKWSYAVQIVFGEAPVSDSVAGLQFQIFEGCKHPPLSADRGSRTAEHRTRGVQPRQASAGTAAYHHSFPSVHQHTRRRSASPVWHKSPATVCRLAAFLLG